MGTHASPELIRIWQARAAAAHTPKVRWPPRQSLFYDVVKLVEQGGPMKWNVGLQVGILTVALTVPSILVTPMAGYAQTQSKERRDDRQDDRKGSRDTKQEGRQDARTEKAACKKGDEKSRAECRQDKRDTKQDAREGAREIKKD
jgi:hypothetical protein